MADLNEVTNKKELIIGPRWPFKKAFAIATLVFLIVQAACWLFVGEYRFPNAPSMWDDDITSYSRWLMVDLGVSYTTAVALDFTNPAPRGIIAFVLAICAFKLARAKVIK